MQRNLIAENDPSKFHSFQNYKLKILFEQHLFGYYVIAYRMFQNTKTLTFPKQIPISIL